MAPTDADLIRRARKDPEALAELYLRHRPQLYAWFRSRLPEAEASELTAELFAQVAISLRRFRDEAGGSAAPWLYGIARNLLRRYHEQGRLETTARRRLGMPIRSYELERRKSSGVSTRPPSGRSSPPRSERCRANNERRSSCESFTSGRTTRSRRSSAAPRPRRGCA